MSTFFPEMVECPHCGDVQLRSLAHSINATRAPQHREAILAGTFQRFTCDACTGVFLADHPFVYIDDVRKQWIGVFPLQVEAEWRELELRPLSSLNLACGPDAPEVAQGLGAGMRPRAVFGLAALREKIVCFDAGLDDSLLEVAKLRALLAPAGLVFDAPRRPRLLEVDGDTLVLLAERQDQPDAGLARCAIARDDCQALALDPAWRQALLALREGPYVDVGRLLG